MSQAPLITPPREMMSTGASRRAFEQRRGGRRHLAAAAVAQQRDRHAAARAIAVLDRGRCRRSARSRSCTSAVRAVGRDADDEDVAQIDDHAEQALRVLRPDASDEAPERREQRVLVERPVEGGVRHDAAHEPHVVGQRGCDRVEKVPRRPACTTNSIGRCRPSTPLAAHRAVDLARVDRRRVDEALVDLAAVPAGPPAERLHRRE